MTRTLLFAGRDIGNVTLVGEDLELDCTTVAALRTCDTLLVEGPRRRYRYRPDGIAREIGAALADGAIPRAALLDHPATEIVNRERDEPAPVLAEALLGDKLVVARAALVDDEQMCNRSAEITVVDLATGKERLVSDTPHLVESFEVFPTARGIYVIERCYVRHFGFDHLGFVPWDADASRWRMNDAFTIQRWFRSGAVVDLRVDTTGDWTCGTAAGRVDAWVLAKVDAFAQEHGPWQSHQWFNEAEHRGWQIGASSTGAWHSVDGDVSALGQALRELIRAVADEIPPLGMAIAADR